MCFIVEMHTHVLPSPFSPSPALQPARPCIMPSWHSHPENHEAICSDPVERLAPMSQHEVETAYQVAQEGSEAFPVICGPAATSFCTLGYQRRALDPSKKDCDSHCYCFCYKSARKLEISSHGGTLPLLFPWNFEHAQNLTVEHRASLRYGMLWYSTGRRCRSGCHLKLRSPVWRPPDTGSELNEDLSDTQLFTVRISE